MKKKDALEEVLGMIEDDCRSIGHSTRPTDYYAKALRTSRYGVMSAIKRLEESGTVKLDTVYDRKGIKRRKITMAGGSR